MFHKGETVCVRPDLEEAMSQHVGVVTQMLKYAGEVCQIIKVMEYYFGAKTYQLSCDNGVWLWSDDMLLPASKEIPEINEEDILHLLGGMIFV